MSQRKIRAKRIKNARGTGSGRRVAQSLFAVVSLVGVLAFVGATTTQTFVAADTGTTEQVNRIDAVHVCMVNNRSYPEPQIAVPVGDRTYYGCCEMCKNTLAMSTKHRSGIDPVSGNPVDKASAVIGALPDGRVLYFENETTFSTFNARAGE